jgi:triphosphatase
MSESNVTTLAPEGARAAAGLNGSPPPQTSKTPPRKRRQAKPIPDKSSDVAAIENGGAAPQSEIAAPVMAARPPTGEIELKLLVDGDRLADFADAPIIAAHARNKGSRKHLKAVYYDTAERALLGRGLTLRVRQSGTRFTQTVKAESKNDPLRRGEWEARVPSMAPDLALALPFLPDELREELAHSPLAPVFTTDIRRRQRVVDLPTGTVEVAFDQGLLTSGDRTMAVNEIELELKGGGRPAIFDIARGLAEHGPVRPSIRSKSARGFELAADAPPAARRSQKLQLDPTIALDDAFAAILRRCFGHLLQSLPAAEDGRDAEGIHQLRVALRRLRTAFDVMRRFGSVKTLETLRVETKWLGQSLSSARDWDIFERATLPTIAKACPSIAGFDALGEIAETRRGGAYDSARAALGSRRCAAFLIALGGWIEARGWRGDVAPDRLAELAEPAVAFARRVLSEQYARTLKRGRRLKTLTIEERHRLRLAVKKLRYVGEFLLPLYGGKKSARRFSRRLAGLQEELGRYNDMAVTASLLAELGAEPGAAAAAIAGWQAHALVGFEPRLRDVWSEFVKAKIPWRDAAG